MPWGVAAAGVAAAGSVYASNKNANTVTQASQQSQPVQSATDQALSQGESIAQRAYTPYTGSVVAPLSTNQQQGVALAQNGDVQGQADLSKASSMLTNLPSYSSSALSQYMNPYVSSVLTPELNEENINYNAQESALLDSKAGAFGGDRAALDAQSLDYVHSQTIASDTGNAYSAAYTNAQNAFFNDQNRQISAANALANAGGDINKMNTQDIQNLMATGGVEQALSQSQLDFDYSQFLENRDWSVTNLQPLLNSIATAKGVSTTSTTSGPQSGIAGQAIGAAATVAGMYFAGNNNNSSSNNPNNASYWGGASNMANAWASSNQPTTPIQGYDPTLSPGMVYNG